MAELDAYLATLTEQKGSDLHISASLPPRIRVDGSMLPLGSDPLAPEVTQRILLEVLPPLNRQEFEKTNDTDFAYHVPGLGRFRANVFRDLYGVGGVFRALSQSIPTPESLGLPEAVKSFCDLPNGLVLVTGPTGSGKSTTLAAMVDLINSKRSDHIITIEDPIEYIHTSKRCLVNHREVRSHTGSFARALRAALREDPDILLVGEMRDLETTRIAIEMAETGHLVLATLHTRTAPSTVDRLIGQFPAGEQEQIRGMVADSLKGVVSQALLRKKPKGRVGAFEVMVVNPAIQNNIREGKIQQIPSIMQIGMKFGMVCLNDALLKLVLQGSVDPAEALSKTQDREDLLAKLRVAGIGAGPAPALGQATPPPTGPPERPEDVSRAART